MYNSHKTALKVLLLFKKDTHEYLSAYQYLKMIALEHWQHEINGILPITDCITAENLIDTLPNLFDDNESKTHQLEQFFLFNDWRLDIADEIFIVDYLYTQMEHEHLMIETTLTPHIYASLISYVFYNFYDEWRKKSKGNCEIMEFLSNWEVTPISSLQTLVAWPSLFACSIEGLRYLLHHKQLSLRLLARNICDARGISLDEDMRHMLCLDDSLYEIENLKEKSKILVMGDVRTGKSTLINHLNGVEYQTMKDRTIKPIFPVHLSKRLASNNYPYSDTRFSQIIGSYIDTPGYSNSFSSHISLYAYNMNNLKGIIVTLNSSQNSFNAMIKELLRLNLNVNVHDSLILVVTRFDVFDNLWEENPSLDELREAIKLNWDITSQIDCIQKTLPQLSENLNNNIKRLKILEYLSKTTNIFFYTRQMLIPKKRDFYKSYHDALIERIQQVKNTHSLSLFIQTPLKPNCHISVWLWKIEDNVFNLFLKYKQCRLDLLDCFKFLQKCQSILQIDTALDEKDSLVYIGTLLYEKIASTYMMRLIEILALFQTNPYMSFVYDYKLLHQEYLMDRTFAHYKKSTAGKHLSAKLKVKFFDKRNSTPVLLNFISPCDLKI